MYNLTQPASHAFSLIKGECRLWNRRQKHWMCKCSSLPSASLDQVKEIEAESSPGADVIKLSSRWVRGLWLLYLRLQSPTRLCSASDQNLRGQNVSKTVSSFVPRTHWRAMKCVSISLCAESVSPSAVGGWVVTYFRLKWTYCYRWVNVEARMNAGCERACGDVGWRERTHRSYDHLWAPADLRASQPHHFCFLSSR